MDAVIQVSDRVPGERTRLVAKGHRSDDRSSTTLGFAFQRIAPGPDGPLWAVRETIEYRDEIYLSGFWTPESCTAIRRRRSSLVVPGGLPVTELVTGDALTVLHTVVSDWPPT